MSAKKPSKSAKLARLKAKERAAKRDKRAPLSDLDIWAIAVHETWLAMQRQGFTKAQAMDYVTSVFHMPRLPDWEVQNPDHTPFEDDEDE
jgi:hypothetical protein